MQPDRYTLSIVTGPATEPVSRDEAKLACRIDSTSENTLIDALIMAAREQVEADSDRKLMPQTWLYTVDRFPSDGGPLWIPVSPMTAVTELHYLDVDDADVELDTASYYLVDNSCPGLVYPAPGFTWPATSLKLGAVTVTLTAGYADAAAVPARAKQAIKMLVGHWYQNRELATDRQTKGVELAYERLVQMLKPGFA